MSNFTIDEAEVVSAISHPKTGNLAGLSKRLMERQPFVYCALQDVLSASQQDADKPKLLETYAESARARIRSLSKWKQDGNETVAAIEAGEIDSDAIAPHVRFDSSEYDKFYGNQSSRLAAMASRLRESNADKDYATFKLGPNVNHSFRYSHAISVVENLLGITGALENVRPVRWMDIGCGTGHFANAVNPARFGLTSWEIVGCDMQAGKIAIAQKQRARGREFFASDAFAMLDAYKKKGEHFDLVSMFEFLEHLDDPLKFMRKLDTFKPKFVLAASPLAQRLNQPKSSKPDRVHLWSFSRRSWEQMFALAGLDVVYSSETRVGGYIGGLDWLSMASGPIDQLRERRTALTGQGEIAVDDD